MNDNLIKVLMIEDSLGDARLISEMIKEVKGESIRIEHAVRLSKGIERLAQNGIDVVLLDLALPDSIGLDTLSKIRDLFPDIPVICLTGREDEELGIQAVQMGAQDYLIKIQVEPNLLLRSIIYAIERKKKDISLLEIEERFEATFEQSAVGIEHIGLDGKWIRINQKFCDILGYSRNELMTMDFKSITHPDDLESEIREMKKLLEGKTEVYGSVKRYLNKNGTTVWARLTLSLFRGRNDEPKYFIAVVEDISQQKTTECILRHETLRLSNIFQKLPFSVMMILLKDERCIYVNEMFTRLTIYKKEEVLSKTFGELKVFSDMHLKEFMKAFDGGKSSITLHDTNLTTATGRVINCSIEVSVIEDQDEKILSFVIIDPISGQEIDKIHLEKQLNM